MSEKYPEWYELPANRWFREGHWARDTQRSHLYEAEYIAWTCIEKSWPSTIIPKQFHTLEEIQAFVIKIFASTWIRKRFQVPFGIRVQVNPRITGGWFSFYRGITLQGSSWSFSAACVIHEIAHGLHCHQDDYSGPGHGRFYARAYIDLVGHLLGPTAQKILKDSFKKHKVKFTPIKHYSSEALAKKKLLGYALGKKFAQV